MNRHIVIGVVVAIILQIVVLVGMVITASLPLWVGTDIRVRTLPIDPRSLFRGNYVRLNYDFSRLYQHQWSSEAKTRKLRVGEVIYVQLHEVGKGLFGPGEASLLQPDNGPFLRGRLLSTEEPYRVKYGIEAFFAPKASALAMESQLANGGIATLSVDHTGRAAIKAIDPPI
jgi:uncharacterized membrane-anchored protein